MTLTGEQVLAIMALIIGPGSIIGLMSKQWADRRVARDTAELNQQATAQINLLAAYQRIADSGDKREVACNDRIDRAIASIAGLTNSVTELSSTLKSISSAAGEITGNQKVMMEELRRVGAILDARKTPPTP